MKIIIHFPNVTVLPNQIMPKIYGSSITMPIVYDHNFPINDNNISFPNISGFHFNNETKALRIELDSHRHGNLLPYLDVAFRFGLLDNRFCSELPYLLNYEHSASAIRWDIVERYVHSSITIIDDFERQRHYVGLPQIITCLLFDDYFCQTIKQKGNNTYFFVSKLLNIWSQLHGYLQYRFSHALQSPNEQSYPVTEQGVAMAIAMLERLDYDKSQLFKLQQYLNNKEVFEPLEITLAYTLTEKQNMVETIVGWHNQYEQLNRCYFEQAYPDHLRYKFRLSTLKTSRYRHYRHSHGTKRFYLEGTAVLHDLRHGICVNDENDFDVVDQYQSVFKKQNRIRRLYRRYKFDDWNSNGSSMKPKRSWKTYRRKQYRTSNKV